jgi:hypothetical protein
MTCRTERTAGWLRLSAVRCNSSTRATESAARVLTQCNQAHSDEGIVNE